ncbi:MAG: pro-sigmaK processing inhibitor BofA family protein [Acutalibacteraceae bacterium]
MIIHRIIDNNNILKKTVLTSLMGIVCLIAINCLTFFTGVSIPISPYSLAISAFGGIPGITLILGLNLFF